MTVGLPARSVKVGPVVRVRTATTVLVRPAKVASLIVNRLCRIKPDRRVVKVAAVVAKALALRQDRVVLKVVDRIPIGCSIALMRTATTNSAVKSSCN